jgi:hypothetical protein
MPPFRLIAVVLGHLAFAGASYATWALGRSFAPEELMMAEVVIYPLIMGVVGIWIWYGFWSYGVLHGPKPGSDT